MVRISLVSSEGLMAVSIMSTLLGVATPCILVEAHQHSDMPSLS
jgi:hypothetical protein